MVKLETIQGPVWVNPEKVIRMWPVMDTHAGLSLGDGDSLEVSGTPEEVHARLFPETTGVGFSDTERNEAMLRVLHAVAHTSRSDWLDVSDAMKADARLALSREDK